MDYHLNGGRSLSYASELIGSVNRRQNYLWVPTWTVCYFFRPTHTLGALVQRFSNLSPLSLHCYRSLRRENGKPYPLPRCLDSCNNLGRSMAFWSVETQFIVFWSLDVLTWGIMCFSDVKFPIVRCFHEFSRIISVSGKVDESFYGYCSKFCIGSALSRAWMVLHL